MQPCRDKWNLGQDLGPGAASPPSLEPEAKVCGSSGGGGPGQPGAGHWLSASCLGLLQELYLELQEGPRVCEKPTHPVPGETSSSSFSLWTISFFIAEISLLH